MRFTMAVVIVFLLFAFAVSSHATMYKWVDEKGRTWITDYPDPNTSKKKSNETATAPDQLKTSKPATESNRDETKKEDQKGDIGKYFPLPQDIRKQIDYLSQAEGIAVIPASVLAMISGFAIFVILAGYIYFSLCLYFIAKKTDVPNPWIAWIPLVNLWTFVSAAGKQWWWAAVVVGMFVLTIVPVAGLIFYLAGIGVTIHLWMLITENLGKNKWLGLLMLVPIANLIFPAILAFSKDDGGRS